MGQKVDLKVAACVLITVLDEKWLMSVLYPQENEMAIRLLVLRKFGIFSVSLT